MKKISRFLAAALCLALLAGCLCGCAKNPAPAEVVSDPASSIVAPPQKSSGARGCREHEKRVY